MRLSKSMSMRQLRGARIMTALVAASAASLATRPAAAYDPATTHAGLTEQSVLASGLHRALARRLSRPLGLFEPITLREGDLGSGETRYLLARLAALDPAGGYRPGDDGAATALSWVVAGAVLAETPPERGQNLFYDPSRGSGLAQGGGLLSLTHGLRLLLDSGGSFRGLATGTSFNLTGLPSTAWLMSPQNDVGLPVFYDQLDAAVSGEEPGRRGTALARALLALGGTLAVLQDAGEPAHVRNDFRGAYLGKGGESPFDRGSSYEHYVAETYGRIGVPPAAAPVARPTVMAYITAADHQGLADRTQRRFFSEGTLPEDAVVDRDTTTVEVVRDARASLAYGLPALPRLELRALGQRRYVFDGKRRLLAYQRVPGRVRFFMDEAVHADSARALLPEVGAYGAGLIDHLLRAEVKLAAEGGAVTVRIEGARGALRSGQVRLYAEDAAGRRRLVATLPAVSAAANETGARASLPAGARRIAAVLRATDDAGELVAVAEQRLP